MKAQYEIIKRILEIYTRTLRIYSNGEQPPIPVPPAYRTLNLEQLLNSKGLLNGLISCYQAVYGSDERNKSGEILWGEGAYCSKEGWSRRIPLLEFETKVKLGKMKCSCGEGDLVPCYPVERMIVKLHLELGSGISPFCTVMDGDDTFPVGGFAWGAICNRREIAERFVAARYQGRESEGWLTAEGLIGELRTMGNDTLLFFDEVAIERRFRGGPGPVQFLIRPGFEIGWNNHVNKALFWTSARSPIYRLASWMGFEPIYQAGDLVFLFNADFVPLLKVLQNFTAERITSILSRVSRKVR